MKTTDNKKAQTFDSKGLIDVNTKEVINNVKYTISI